MIRNVIYIFLGLFILSCEKYEPDIGDPQAAIHDATFFDNSTIDLSWEGNDYASDFSYRLEPLGYIDTVDTYTNWSEWSTDTSITLKHLDEGNYNFYVKSRFNIETEQAVPVSISFTVDAISGPALRMYPLYQAVSSGSSCAIYLYVEDVVDLMSFQVDVSYNTEAIADISINAVGLLSNLFDTDSEYSDGVMRIITTSSENFISINGDGAVAKLTFTSTGSDTLHFLQSSVFKNSLNHSIEILERVEGIIEVVE